MLPALQDIRFARSKMTGEPSPDEIDYELRMKEEEEERAGLATVEHHTVGGHHVRLPVNPSADAVLRATADAKQLAAVTAVDVGVGEGDVISSGAGAAAIALTPRAGVAAAIADPTAEGAIGSLALPLEALGHTTFQVRARRRTKS
jgi:hypothetical protein